MASDSLVVKSYREEEGTAPTEELDYRSYQGVMGRPGVDFPVLRNIPATDFNCRDVKRPGYYADLATDCQVFHICDGGRKISFLCPNGTIFRQSHLICDWWFRVDCGKSVELYEESAEQLAADQKIYQARSIERERRRKLGKTTQDGDDDFTGGEVYSQDETPDGRSRTQTRNSKKVLDSKSAEKFPNYYRGGKDDARKPNDDRINFGKVNDRSPNNQGTFSQNYQNPYTPAPTPFSTSSPKQNYQNPYTPAPNAFSTSNSFKQNYQSSFTPSPVTFSTSNYKSRSFGDASRHRENIQGAESGSLVGNLRSSARSENSLHFDAKLPELRVRGTSTERPFTNIRSTTEARRPDFYRTSTVRPETSRRFTEASSTVSRDFHPFRGQNLIRTTPKYVSTEKYTPEIRHQTPEPNKFFSTTEHKRLSSLAPFSSTPGPFSVTPTKPNADEKLSTDKASVGALYYATYHPDKNVELTTTPRVDISLSQLNINKPTAQTLEEKNYEDSVREGLEIPPSSGPNALRSFALYFAGNGGDAFKRGKDANLEQKDLFYIPTVKEVEQKLNTFEEKGKDVVQRVDTIIKDNAEGTGEGSSAAGALPNSLTQQTRDSYSALFDKNHTQTERQDYVTEPDFGTTAFEDFTEEAEKINAELRKNDLDSSQSRGLLEPDSRANQLNDEFSKVSPDLRELAQVFTKALSAYLDDPEAFRKVLSEIRPTEPGVTEASTNPVDYPSVTQEDDEVLDFSDVTKTSYRRRTTTVAYRETTTEPPTEPPTTTADVENFVVALNAKENQSYVKVPDLELTAPLIESLDESQSSYYTPLPSVVGTTNAIAEEINNEFRGSDKLPDIDSNEAVDSYLPIRGSVDDKSRPRYGGFQNNTNYSPYGAELTTKSYSPYGSELTTTPVSLTKDNDNEVPTTFNPRNISSSIFFRRKPEAVVTKQNTDISSLAKQLNNLAETDKGVTSVAEPAIPQFESIKLGNGETIERIRTRSTTAQPPSSTSASAPSSTPKELSIELSPPFITDPANSYYEFDSSLNKNKDEYVTTTSYPTTVTDQAAETFPPTSYAQLDSSTSKYTRSTTEEAPVDDLFTAPTPKSFERIAELQQTLMFKSQNVTHQQMEKARITVAEAVDNMTDSTANTLMKMMEMAAKNETYRRLVLLLVNDKSGKNKTVEETRLALLTALLMPVISTSRTRRLDVEPPTTLIPATTTTTTTTTTTVSSTTKDAKRRGHFRRSKSIANGETGNVVRITTESPKERAKNGRRTKSRVVSRIVKTTEPPTTIAPNRLSNLELINRTIENSKLKDIKNNSLEDAILDSDSRAVELLRSLYSLAARWG